MVFSLDRLDCDAAWGSHHVRSACSSIIGDEVTRITVAFILVMEGADDPPLEHRAQALCCPPAVYAGPHRSGWHGDLCGRPADGRDRHGGGGQPPGPRGGERP